jgi:AcrR family transcriptional regulator
VSGSRDRICDALLDLAYRKGLSEIAVEEVREQAGVSGAEFDRLFPSKEACAIAVFERTLSNFRSLIIPAYESEARWPDSLRAAAYAMAQWITANPRETRFGAIELLWGGELAQASREAAFRSFLYMIDAGRDEAEDPDAVPAHAAEGIMGSITAMITRRALHGRVEPYEFVPEIMYRAVRPYLGEETAKKELATPPPRPAGQD